MVKFSSNVKRPKAVLKQSGKQLSKEAPVLHQKDTSKQHNHNRTIIGHQDVAPHPNLHSHSRSLPANSRISVLSEIGLTSSDAIKALIEEIDKFVSNLSFFRNNGLSFSFVVFVPLMRYLNLLVLALWAYRTSNWPICWLCGSFLSLEVIFIELIERNRNTQTLPSAIKKIRSMLRKLDKSLLAGNVDFEEFYSISVSVPLSSAISYVRVIRDGKLRLICSNLLVSGDFVVLLAGEKLNRLNFVCQPLNLLLTPLQRASIGLPVDATIVQVERAPISNILENQFKLPRRTKFVFSQLQDKLQNGINLILCLLVPVLPLAKGIMMVNSVLFLAPLILLSSPLLHFFWWVISTCYLSLLADQLISSKTPFSEAADPLDIDEFDEDAPPPVKNIKIPLWKVILEVFSLLFGVKENSSGAILKFWDGDVIEVLALTSVLCFIDREGTISTAHSRPCELIIPTTNQFELAAIELIPLISDPLRVRPALNNNPRLGLSSEDLRIIGLSLLLTAECSTDNNWPHCRHGAILSNLCHFLPEHLQTCYCNLAREIGFDSSIMNRFSHVKTVWSQHNTTSKSSNNNSASVKHKRSSTVTVVIEDQWRSGKDDAIDVDEPIGHLFTFGEASDILRISQLSFAKNDGIPNSSKITELSDSLRRKLIDFEGTMGSCDIHCVAFSYRPLFREEAAANASISDLRGNIFLGLVSVCPEPKEHFQEFVDDLEAAGMRFAYFSPFREQPSKAFGERLGLETDWNSCILLSEHPNPASQSPGYSALSDIKARLPRGIQAIRPHLESVDDIPLHVSIFAECNSQNTSEMIEIYQETGEIVGIIGSSRSIRNMKCFSKAHFSIGCDPLSSSSNKHSMDQIASSINSVSFKLILPADFSPYILTELLRESRTILHNSICAWEFLAGGLVSVSIAAIVSEKPILGSCWILLGSVLIAAFALILGPHDPFVMKTHSTVLDHSKCPKEISSSFFFSTLKIPILRFIPSMLSFLLFDYFSFSSVNTFLLVLLVQSVSFTHFSQRPVLNNPVLIMVVVLGSCISLLLSGSNIKRIILSSIASLLSGGICVVWHEIIKSAHLKENYNQLQKRSKLLFNTKLGMHSPI